MYDALIDFIGHYLKRSRHKYTEWGWKKNDMNLYSDIFSFIVDIWPGSEYPSDVRNKFIIIIIIIITVKPALTTTFLKRPPVLNDHVVVLP